MVAYNDILDYLERAMSDPSDIHWTFKDILAHEGPLKPGDLSCKGSNYDVLIHWEDSSQTHEPLHIIAQIVP